MNKYSKLQKLTDSQLESISLDSDHPDTEEATEILNERTHADYDPRVGALLGFKDSMDYFSISTEPLFI